MLALYCAPEGRPDVATAAVMLAGLLPWRGLARLELHVRDGDELLHAQLVAVAAISPFPFLFARSVAQVQLGEGGVLAAPTLAAEGRVGEVRWRCANAGANDMIVVIYRQGREASGDVAGQSSRWG